MNDLQIARVGSDEYAAYCSLLEWRRTGDPAADIGRYQDEQFQQFLQERRLLESDSFFIYAARQDGRFVGYVNAALMPKPDPRRGSLYIDELWTAPPYRGRGIAGQLLQRTIRLAEQLRLWRVRLYVNADNDSARACYRKVGFREQEDCLFCELDVAAIAAEEQPGDQTLQTKQGTVAPVGVKSQPDQDQADRS